MRTVAFRVSISSLRKTINRFTAHRRAAARVGILPGLSPDRLAIMSALQRIPAEQRQAIVLYHLLDRSVEQISREIGAPSGTSADRRCGGRGQLDGTSRR